ncbi:MAG: glucoamylase family protein, partial [Aquaticitalea sp.]
MKKLTYLVYLFLIINSCSKNSPSEPFIPPDPVDDVPDPVNTITDEELMDLTQESTFKYFWDFAQTNSKAARERYHPTNPSLDQNIVTTGGSGFGLMAILVGIERGYVTRGEAVARLKTILTFFETANRFHGAWPHWINGTNGSVIPFSPQDNGGDLVETAFFTQGLICVKEYFKNGSTEEIALSDKADALWKGVEWNWYTQGQNALYWHWSPNYGFAINLKLQGYNETLITYILAAASPNFPITLAAYTQGWANNGGIISANTQYNIPLILKHSGSEQFGGPLFFAHYSYLGLKPLGLSDQYANYWDVNVNHTNINYQYCV